MADNDPDIVTIARGKRFDFAKVLIAHERLIDAFAAEFGAGTLLLPRRGTSMSRHSWDEQGKHEARSYWMRLKTVLDASDNRICHAFGKVHVQSQLLGSWAPSPAGASDLVEVFMENEPVAYVFGPEIAEDESHLLFAMPSPEIVARAERLLGWAVPDLRLAFSLSLPSSGTPAPGVHEQPYGIITFSHGVYGDGFGPVRTKVGRHAGGRTRTALN